MVLNITEEQKRVIEERGHMVIEFKMWVHKMGFVIKDVWNAVVFFIQDTMERVVIPYLEKIEENLKCLFCFAKDDGVLSKDYNCQRFKFSPVRFIGRKYEKTIWKKKIYYRCRDNC